MEHRTILIILSSALLLLSVYSILHSFNKIKRNRKLLKRNEELLPFLQRILREHPDVYYKLPSYTEMLYSNKPLEDEYWLPKEYLDKKNRFGLE